MSYIKVDHSKLESTATEVEEYVALLKRKMNDAQCRVSTLSSSWQGNDFAKFQEQFNQVYNEDSTYVQMIKELESYARYLRYAAEKDKKTQADAVDRARKLPK